MHTPHEIIFFATQKILFHFGIVMKLVKFQEKTYIKYHEERPGFEPVTLGLLDQCANHYAMVTELLVMLKFIVYKLQNPARTRTVL